MAEALGAAASIAGIVGFGLQLATTIQTYVESVMEAEERLRDIAFDINSTASALKQLQEIVDTDRAAGIEHQKPRVFKDEGLEEIEAMAVQCQKVYLSIVVFITKAGATGRKGKVSVTFVNVQMLKISSLGNLKWPWLEPRIKRCQDKLRWLKMNLLFNLQLASLARLQIDTTVRVTGSFDEELALRATAQQLRQNRIKYAKKLASKFKKEEEAKSVSEFDAVPSAHPESGNAFRDVQTQQEAKDMPIQDILPANFKSTRLDPEPLEKPKRLPSGPTLNEIITDTDSDEKGDLPPFNGVPELSNYNNNELAEDLKEAPQSITEVQSSNTSVDDTEKPNPYETTVEDDVINEEIVMDEKVRPPSPVQPPMEIRKETVFAEPSSVKAAEVSEDSKDKYVTDDKSKPEAMSFPIYEQKYFLLPIWLKRMFCKHDKFLHDWESPVLEAFVVHKDSQTPLKLPFGHQRLTFGLKQVIKKGNYLSWDQYLALELQHQRAIEQIVADAKQVDSRQRTFLALTRKTAPDGDRILVFFSLGGLGEAAQLMGSIGRKPSFPFGRDRTWELRTRIVEAELAKLKAEAEGPAKAAELAAMDKTRVLKFRDCVGRKFSFPFHLCKSWAGMEELIKQAFLHVDIIGPHVHEGHYDLVGANGDIILPQVWESLIQPDWAITMHMWPMPEPPRAAPDGVHVVDVGPGRTGAPRPGDRADQSLGLSAPFQCRRGPPPPPPGWIGPPPCDENIVDLGPGPSRRRRGPPPPPGWIGPMPGARTGDHYDEDSDIIIIEETPVAKSSKKKSFNKSKYTSHYDSDSNVDSDDTDSDKLVSDSDIDDDGIDEQLGIDIDFQMEEKKAAVPLGELLGMWTNATDTWDNIIPEALDSGESDSDSDSGIRSFYDD